MARGRKTGGRDFRPGNPGKPQGAKDRLPRGLLRGLVMAAMEQREQVVVTMIERCLKKPAPFLKMLELAAKLNREIGVGAEAGSAPPTVINFNSPVNPRRLRERLEQRGRSGHGAPGRSVSPEEPEPEGTDSWGSV